MVCIRAECPVLAAMYSFVVNVIACICMMCFFLFHSMTSVSRAIDDVSLSYADVVSELAMVRDGMLASTDSHFSIADACSFIEFLCTVWGLKFYFYFFNVLWVWINNNNKRKVTRMMFITVLVLWILCLSAQTIIMSDCIIRGDLANVRIGRHCIISQKTVIRPPFKKFSKGSVT